MVFDGKGFAREIEKRLRDRVIELIKQNGRAPKLVTFYNPEDTASRVYTNIKEKKAQELGIFFEKIPIFKSQDPNKVKILISNYNQDPNVDGIMIQTPLFDRETDKQLCQLIALNKDCDGLREDSPFVPATVRAVLEILSYSLATSPLTPLQNLGEGNIVVVGQRGLVGKEVLKRIAGAVGMSAGELNLDVLKSADVVISATGRESLIKPEMIKEGAVCIDVGYPKGDFSAEVAEKSSFFTPVPGGVGPVTVAMLFANLVRV